MNIIREYEIVVKIYHDEPVARIRYSVNGKTEESNLYSLGEIDNLVRLWECGELLGSFAIGTKLERGARYTLVNGGFKVERT